MPRHLLLAALIAVLALVYMGLRYLDRVYLEAYGDPQLPEGFQMQPDAAPR